MIRQIAILPMLLLGHVIFSQTIVNSLQDLLPYLDDDNVDIVLAPGTYAITTQDASNGLFDHAIDLEGRLSNSLLLFSGNGSTYDFTDVTINVETGVFKAYGGSTQVYEVHTVGNDNVLLNLTQVDLGSVHDNPSKGACNIVMDGRNNRIEGFHVTVKGSTPYGYGDAFGKGGGPVISHRKHSACLVRGDLNHVKGCTFIHHSYGHCIFTQGCSNPTIEDCYVEGEVRTTDDMLAEEGTGSAADNVDFMTVWGYRLPPGYMMSTGEAGIRAYNGGETIMDGVHYTGVGTSNPTVINCTVKFMRTGVTLAHASGTKYVEGCTAIACENGFSLGSGTLLNCSADCAYGPVYASTYQNDKNYDAEITILPATVPYYNGSKTVAYFGGSSHEVTFQGTEANVPPDYRIKVGGAKEIVRLLGTNSPNQNNLTASSNVINNYSAFPIDIVTGSDNNEIETCASVTNNGSGNTITQLPSCQYSPVCGDFDAYSTIEAEEFCETLGAGVAGGGTCIGSIFDGDWVKYDAVNFGSASANGIVLELAKAHEGATSFDVVLDDLNNNPVGTVDVPYTAGGWYAWQTVTAQILGVIGTHDVFLVFHNPDPATGVVNVESFYFVDNVECLLGSVSRFEAECYSDMSGIDTEDCDEGGLNVGFVQDGDWISFNDLDLTAMKSAKFRYASAGAGGSVEIHQGAVAGPLLGTMAIPVTNGWQSWQSDSTNISSLTGMHDVFFVFKGGAGYLFNLNWIGFSEEELLVTSIESEPVSDLLFYPNPSSGIIHFNQSIQFTILNAFGATVSSGEGTEADLSAVGQGVYFLNVEGGLFKVLKN